jgi:hypothetical protein
VNFSTLPEVNFSGLCPKNSLHFVLDLLYIIKETIGCPKPAVSGHFNDQFVPDFGKRGNYREILETV